MTMRNRTLSRPQSFLRAASPAALVLALAAPLALQPLPAHAQGRITDSLANTNPRGRVVPVDRIVAVVEGEAITAIELSERMRMVRAQMRRSNAPVPGAQDLERQVLDRLINDKVQVQFAKETGIRVDEATLDRAVARMAEDNRVTLRDFRDRLEKDGIPFNRFREELREEILISRVREREVDRIVTISEAEIEEFLKDNGGQNAGAVEYNLSQVLVRVPENASPEVIEQRKKRADEALAQLRAGKDFREVSAAFSDAQEALTGGNLGFRSSDRLPDLFVEAAAKLKPGEIAPLLRSPNGFHILKLEDSRGGASGVVVVQTRARHILVKTNEITSSSEAERRIRAMKDRLDNKAIEFAELARQQSQDSSAPRGGDLGWVYPGDTVPEFERAMDALQPGQISAPVQSPFGWHLIQVVERKRDDASRDRLRQFARGSIRERKADEAYQDWLRQQRDRAYVELRLDER
jgi:peptidyl-prolyl cis-trans isomerase SurA